MKNSTFNDINSKCYTETFGYFRGALCKTFSGISNARMKDLYHDSLLSLGEGYAAGKYEGREMNTKAYLVRAGFNMQCRSLDRGVSTISTDSSAEPNAVIAKMEKSRELENAYGTYSDDNLCSLLYKVMQELGEKQNQLLRLFYFEKKSMKEIAKIMGYSNETTARTLRNKYVKILRVLMKKRMAEAGYDIENYFKLPNLAIAG